VIRTLIVYCERVILAVFADTYEVSAGGQGGGPGTGDPRVSIGSVVVVGLDRIDEVIGRVQRHHGVAAEVASGFNRDIGRVSEGERDPVDIAAFMEGVCLRGAIGRDRICLARRIVDLELIGRLDPQRVTVDGGVLTVLGDPHEVGSGGQGIASTTLDGRVAAHSVVVIRIEGGHGIGCGIEFQYGVAADVSFRRDRDQRGLVDSELHPVDVGSLVQGADLGCAVGRDRAGLAGAVVHLVDIGGHPQRVEGQRIVLAVFAHPSQIRAGREIGRNPRVQSGAAAIGAGDQRRAIRGVEVEHSVPPFHPVGAEDHGAGLGQREADPVHISSLMQGVRL